MCKKLVLIVLSLIIFSEKQYTAFRYSVPFLKKQATLFTKKFLEIENQRPVIENIQIFSFVPIEQDLKLKIYQMQEQKGTLVKMILSASVFKNEQKMVERIKNKNSIVACLPSMYDDLDWHLTHDTLKNKIDCKLFHKPGFKGTSQAALFTAECLEQDLIVSKELTIEKESKECLLMINEHKLLLLFENSFDQVLQEHKK